MKPAWSQVKLRVAFGDVPEFGDELRIESTGRRYQVIGVRGRTLTCLVLPREAEVTGRVLPWQWCSRRRRARA
ncbi:hypothetical protein LJR084_001898 [Variovorax sp. LjRoot84]|uniref:hypothetical protein n=1 Tax=Variovorax sp. LjRoot84 TaxID=3342340 RepID=UPI003ECC38FA